MSPSCTAAGSWLQTVETAIKLETSQRNRPGVGGYRNRRGHPVIEMARIRTANEETEHGCSKAEVARKPGLIKAIPSMCREPMCGLKPGCSRSSKTQVACTVLQVIVCFFIIESAEASTSLVAVFPFTWLCCGLGACVYDVRSVSTEFFSLTPDVLPFFVFDPAGRGFVHVGRMGCDQWKHRW